jgi:hypothetical protein
LISVLGLSPERAIELLSAEGYSVTLEEARSKKGIDGATQPRIIRQALPDEGKIALIYAAFRTEPAESKL